MTQQQEAVVVDNKISFRRLCIPKSTKLNDTVARGGCFESIGKISDV